MLSLSNLLLAWSAICSVAYGNSDGLIAAHRREADEQTVNTLAALRKRGTGELPTKLGKSLYWFGHFDVGEGHDYHLLLDTGSSDCILNNNLYVKRCFKLRTWLFLGDISFGCRSLFNSISIDINHHSTRSPMGQETSQSVTRASIEPDLGLKQCVSAIIQCYWSNTLIECVN
jgi:hypothetical protein